MSRKIFLKEQLVSLLQDKASYMNDYIDMLSPSESRLLPSIKSAARKIKVSGEHSPNLNSSEKEALEYVLEDLNYFYSAELGISHKMGNVSSLHLPEGS